MQICSICFSEAQLYWAILVLCTKLQQIDARWLGNLENLGNWQQRFPFSGSTRWVQVWVISQTSPNICNKLQLNWIIIIVIFKVTLKPWCAVIRGAQYGQKGQLWLILENDA